MAAREPVIHFQRGNADYGQIVQCGAHLRAGRRWSPLPAGTPPKVQLGATEDERQVTCRRCRKSLAASWRDAGLG